VVFPGPAASAPAYNRELLDRAKLLPATLGDPRGQAGQETEFVTLQAKNFEHSIASLWNDPAAGSPASAHFYRRFQLVAPTDPANNGAVVLRYADGSPAVMERPVGLGRVVLFSSTADTSWCDLPVRPGIFVPLVQRVLGSIVARQDEALNVGVGRSIVYRVPLDTIGRDVTVNGPGGIRDIRRVELLDGAATVQFDQTPLAGAYGVTIAAPAGEQPTNLLFAVQADSRESRLDALSDDDLKSLQTVAQITRWDAATSLDQPIRSSVRGGAELWGTLAMIALFLAAGEAVLANWFSRAK
jgi:hypothetical protein